MATGNFCWRWTNIAPSCFCCKSSLWAAGDYLFFFLDEEWTQSWFHNISAWKSSCSWEVGAVILILANKTENCSQIFSDAGALYGRLLNCSMRRKAAWPFQQLLTETAGAVFCMKPCVLGVIWALFLSQTSEEEEHLLWDVCRGAVMTKYSMVTKLRQLEATKSINL